MYIAKELNDFEEVDHLHERIPHGTISTTVLEILRVRLAIAHGDPKLANDLADQARKNLREEASADDRRNLAMVLCLLSRFDDALPLCQQLAPLHVFGNDTKRFLDCSMRTERYDIALNVCRTLHKNGIEDPGSLRPKCSSSKDTTHVRLFLAEVETVALAEVVDLTKSLMMKISREDILPERKNSVMIAILGNLVRRGGLGVVLTIRRALLRRLVSML
jgi:hypothetical protein